MLDVIAGSGICIIASAIYSFLFTHRCCVAIVIARRNGNERNTLTNQVYDINFHSISLTIALLSLCTSFELSNVHYYEQTRIKQTILHSDEGTEKVWWKRICSHEHRRSLEIICVLFKWNVFPSANANIKCPSTGTECVTTASESAIRCICITTATLTSHWME